MDGKETKSKPTTVSPESETLKETKLKPTIADQKIKKTSWGFAVPSSGQAGAS